MIKEELIDRVDIRTVLAPILGPTSGKSSDEIDGILTAHRVSSLHEDDDYNRQSSQRLRTRGYDRGIGIGMARDKRDRVVRTSTTITL